MKHDLNEKEILLQIILEQIRRHQGFYIQDLYKMLYQASCGGRHLLMDPVESKKKLLEEWDSSERIPKGEPLLEVIDPRGEVIRVNIRIYKKTGGKLDELFKAFQQSAMNFPDDKDRFIGLWGVAMELAENREIPFSKVLMEDFLIDQGKLDLPMIHHSDPYIDANRPSYRVVLKQYWAGHGNKSEKDNE